MCHMDTFCRTPYDSDVSDEEWAFLAPYLTLMREDVTEPDTVRGWAARPAHWVALDDATLRIGFSAGPPGGSHRLWPEARG